MKKYLPIITHGVMILFFLIMAISILTVTGITGTNVGECSMGILDTLLYRGYEMTESYSDSSSDDDLYDDYGYSSDENKYSYDYKKNHEVEENIINTAMSQAKMIDEKANIWGQIKILSAYTQLSNRLETKSIKKFNYAYFLRIVYIIINFAYALVCIFLFVFDICKMKKRNFKNEAIIHQMQYLLFGYVAILVIAQAISNFENLTISPSFWIIFSILLLVNIAHLVFDFLAKIDSATNLIDYLLNKNIRIFMTTMNIVVIALLFVPWKGQSISSTFTNVLERYCDYAWTFEKQDTTTAGDSSEINSKKENTDEILEAKSFLNKYILFGIVIYLILILAITSLIMISKSDRMSGVLIISFVGVLITIYLLFTAHASVDLANEMAAKNNYYTSEYKYVPGVLYLLLGSYCAIIGKYYINKMITKKIR